MPELPEVETAVRGVSPYWKITWLKNRGTSAETPLGSLAGISDIASSKNSGSEPPRQIPYHHTEKGYIIGHLGMSGTVRIVPHDCPVDKHDHLDIVLNNDRLLRYNDPRRFGAWLWTEKLDEFHLFLKLGPEPLSEEFNADYLFKKSRKKNDRT